MSPKGPRGNFKHQSVRVSMASIYSSHWNGRTGNTSNSSKKIMYDPWNFGGAKSFIFRGLGGLAPPSPYVEPPLMYVLLLGTTHIRYMHIDGLHVYNVPYGYACVGVEKSCRYGDGHKDPMGA